MNENVVFKWKGSICVKCPVMETCFVFDLAVVALWQRTPYIMKKLYNYNKII